MYCTINRMEWNEGLEAGEKRTDARKRVNQYTGILFAHPKAISNWLYHRPPMSCIISPAYFCCKI